MLSWCRSDLEVLDIVPPIPIVHAPEKPPRWLAKEDQTKILEHIPEEDHPIIKYLMLSGCRPAEARALRVRDVDLRQETVTISSTFSGHVLREQRKGRGSVPVTLPIHLEVLAYFKKSCALSLPGAFVFINPGVMAAPIRKGPCRRSGRRCGSEPSFPRISLYTMRPGIPWPPSSVWPAFPSRTSRTSSATAISGRR